MRYLLARSSLNSVASLRFHYPSYQSYRSLLTIEPVIALNAAQKYVINCKDPIHINIIGNPGTGKSLAAAERVLAIIKEGDYSNRKVLALTGSSSPSFLSTYIDDKMTFNTLERYGHGVYSFKQWMQLSLQEAGYDRRLLSFRELCALVDSHRNEFHYEKLQTNLLSTQQKWKYISDLVLFFQILEKDNISPTMYQNYVARSTNLNNKKHEESLADCYATYWNLLHAKNSTSYHGIVMEFINHCQNTSNFLSTSLYGYTDIVVDEVELMTTGMKKALTPILSYKDIITSVCLTRPDNLNYDQEVKSSIRLEKLLGKSIKKQMHLDYWKRSYRHSTESTLPYVIQAIQTQNNLQTLTQSKQSFDVTCKSFQNHNEEEKWLKNLLDNVKKEGNKAAPPKTIAILLPRLKDVDRVYRFLQNLQDPEIQIHLDNYTSKRLRPRLFDQTGAHELYSLLMALYYSKNGKGTHYLYHVLRSNFFYSLPQDFISRVMIHYHEKKSTTNNYPQDSITLLDVLKYVLDNPMDGIDDESRKNLVAFINFIDTLQQYAHQVSAAELIEMALEKSGRINSLLEPQTEEDEAISLSVAAFSKELESAQEAASSPYLSMIAPYLLAIQQTAVLSESAALDRLITDEVKVRVQLLELNSRLYDELHEIDIAMFLSMADRSFPGRMKRLLLPLPKKLLSENKMHDLPQSRPEYIHNFERLIAYACSKVKSNLYLSFTSKMIDTKEGKIDTVSRILVPLWFENKALLDTKTIEKNGLVEITDSKLSLSNSTPYISEVNSVGYVPSHLSYSQIQDYLVCPRRYYLSRIIRLENAPTQAMLLGSFLHECAAKFAHALQASKLSFDAAKSTAMTYFQSAWASNPHFHFTSAAQEQHMHLGCKQSFQLFMENYIQLQSNDDPIDIMAIEEPFEIDIIGLDFPIRLRGVWDRVDRNSKSNTITICELKSNPNGAVRNAQKMADESLQLKIYLVAYNRLYLENNTSKTKLQASLEVIGKKEKGTILYSPAMDEEVKEIFIGVAENIRQGFFQATPNYMNCSYCPFAFTSCDAHKGLQSDAT